jgi:hypothetical protein
VRIERSSRGSLAVVEDFGFSEFLFQVGIDFSGEGGFSHHVDRWPVSIPFIRDRGLSASSGRSVLLFLPSSHADSICSVRLFLLKPLFKYSFGHSSFLIRS